MKRAADIFIGFEIWIFYSNMKKKNENDKKMLAF